MPNFDPVLFARQSEQVEEMLSQCGPLVKAYYETLKDSGFPEDLARELTLHWHDIFWQNTLDWKRNQIRNG